MSDDKITHISILTRLLHFTAVIDWIQYKSIASSVPPSDACSVTSHSSLLTTPTALYASSESLITSAESILTTLYPSTTPPFPSSTVTPNTPHLQTSTPHLQTVTGSIHSSPIMSCTYTLYILLRLFQRDRL